MKKFLYIAFDLIMFHIFYCGFTALLIFVGLQYDIIVVLISGIILGILYPFALHNFWKTSLEECRRKGL